MDRIAGLMYMRFSFDDGNFDLFALDWVPIYFNKTFSNQLNHASIQTGVLCNATLHFDG